jgi:hypothetical protein
MATQAYWDWVAAGEPWRACRPAADIKAALVDQLGQGVAVHLGTIGNRETHLMVDYPQDHAPFSFTKWPVQVGNIVCALDIMHKPNLGLDCRDLFGYWLAEAKAGRTPWLKYLIWQAKLHDVRNDWRAEPNSGHYDHIHLSFRTDWIDKGIGDWSPLPGGDWMPALSDDQQRHMYLTAVNIESLLHALATGKAVRPKWTSDKAKFTFPEVTLTAVDWLKAASAAGVEIDYDELGRAIVRALLEK